MIFKGGGDASGGGGGGNVNVTEIGGAVQGSANVVDQGNQALRVNIVAGAGAGGTSSNFGSSFPSAGTAVGAQNPTGKMAAVNVDGSGNLLVNVAVGGGASSGSTTAYQGSAPWAVVGSGGLFPVTGSGGLIGANVSQLGGAALGSANVVDQGNQALRVNIVAGAGAGGTSSNFGSSFPSSGTAVGAQTSGGKMAALNVDGSGNLMVNVQVGGGASSGSTTAYQGSAPWSDNLVAVGGSSISLGQTTMAKSLPVAIASDQGAITVFNGTLDSGNSSTAILGSSGGIFTGAALNVFNQTATNVYVYSDQSSATNGVSLQFSSDGTNWHETDAYTYTAGSNALIITTPTRAEYFRLVYTNGTVAQTVFQLQTIHKFSPAFGNITEVIDTFGTQAHVQLTKALLNGWQGSSIVALVLGSSGQLGVAGSGGLFPVTGSIAVVGSGGLFPISGSATVYQGTLPWAVAGSGGQFAVVGSGGLFPVTNSGGVVGIVGSTASGALSVVGSGGLFPVTGSIAVVGSGGIFPISGSATVYQGSSQWVVTGSGGLFPVVNSGGVVGIVGSTSSGALSVIGSGGLMAINGSATVYEGSAPWSVTGSGGLFPVSGSATVYQGSAPWSITGATTPGSSTVYQGTLPWAVAGSGGQIAVVGSGGQVAVVGSGGLFPITGSGGQMTVALTGSGGLVPITGSGGVIGVSGVSGLFPATQITIPWSVTQIPVIGSGHLTNVLVSANTTNGTAIKSTPGSVYGWAIGNTNGSSIRYVKMYSKGTTVSVGTDTPILNLMIPYNAGGAGMVAAEYVNGITFGSGIAYAITANAPTTDSTAIGSGDIVMNLFYN